MFFVAFLPQFLDPARSVPLQIGILAVTSAAAEFLVLAGYGFAAGTLATWARAPRVARGTHRVAGTLACRRRRRSRRCSHALMHRSRELIHFADELAKPPSYSASHLRHRPGSAPNSHFPRPVSGVSLVPG